MPLINLWLLFSCYFRTYTPKAREKVYFFMISLSPGVPFARKAINAFIYRSMKQGYHALCITEATLSEIGVFRQDRRNNKLC